MKTPFLFALLLATGLAQGQTEEDAKVLMEIGTPPATPYVEYVADTLPFVPLTFKGSLTLDRRSYKEGVEVTDQSATLRLWVREDRLAGEFMSDGTQKRLIVDLKNKSMYVLFFDPDGSNNWMKQPLKKAMIRGAEEDSTFALVRTNERRTIEKQHCIKYTVSSAQGIGESWYAEGEKLDVMGALSHFGGGEPVDHRLGLLPHGVMMESTWTSTDGTQRSTSTIRNFVVGKVDPEAFSTDGFPVIDLGIFGH